MLVNPPPPRHRNQAAKKLRPRKNCRRSANGISKYIFLNESVWMSLKVSLKFVRKFWIHNVLALIQIMAWRRPGETHYLNQWGLVFWRIYASQSVNCIQMICTRSYRDIYIQVSMYYKSIYHKWSSLSFGKVLTSVNFYQNKDVSIAKLNPKCQKLNNCEQIG